MKKLLLFLAVSFGLHAQNSLFELPPLPYTYSDLEPYIDTQTMQIHYERHHKGYMNNLNKELTEKEIALRNLDDLLIFYSARNAVIRNNGGGYYNHNLFWTILAPKGNMKISPELSAAITQKFGSMENFKTEILKAAANRFGSGWAWLVVTPAKELAICSTPNQDNPLMDGADVRGIPILGIDVWEHAYYLKYQNKRADYLEAVYTILNWEEISKRYAEALKNHSLLKTIDSHSWKELKEFHKVMSQTYHPAEENDLKPIKTRINEFVEKAKILQASPIPVTLQTSDIKKALNDLVKGGEELKVMIVKKRPDAQIKQKLTDLHEVFHIIQGICYH